jgi:hypothetical protein
MLRLGHIAFFGIAFVNLAFAGTVAAGWSRPPGYSAWALAAAEVLMPGVCFLAAWKKPMRQLFVLPVACVAVGVGGVLVNFQFSIFDF